MISKDGKPGVVKLPSCFNPMVGPTCALDDNGGHQRRNYFKVHEEEAEWLSADMAVVCLKIDLTPL